jgi:hypothetical protein
MSSTRARRRTRLSGGDVRRRDHCDETKHTPEHATRGEWLRRTSGGSTPLTTRETDISRVPEGAETITSHQVRPRPGIEERRERVECVSRQAMTKNPSELLRHPTDMTDDDVRHPDEPIEPLDQPKATRWRMKQRFRRAQRNIPRTPSTQQAPRYK